MRAVLILPFGLWACAAPPEVDVTRFEAQAPPTPPGFPELAPVEEVIAGTTGLPNPPDPSAAALQGPAGALRSRAAALSGPVIPPEERARLEAAGRR